MGRGRKPTVRYWPSRKGGGYFCTLQGWQVDLALGPDDQPDGPTYLAALDQFTKLMRLEEGKGGDGYLVSALFNQYRRNLTDKDKERPRDPTRLETFERYARSFCKLYGTLPVGALRAYHFDDWLAGRDGWNATTRHHAGRHVLACINWGVKKGYVATNPVAEKIELPEPLRRGREARMPDGLCRLLIEKSFSKEFRLFLKILWLTGARPVELRRATARNYLAGRIVHRANPSPGEYRHKNIRTGKDRVVYLPDELVPEVEALVRKYPAGPIFRSPRGSAWTTANLSLTWLRLARRKEVQDYCAANGRNMDDFTPSCYRHTFASAWIDSGRSIDVLAELLGTSVAMLERVYGHPDVETMHRHYREFLEQDWLVAGHQSSS
jgi:integrase